MERNGIERTVVERIDAEEKRVRASSRAAGELEEARSRALDKEIRRAERILNESKNVLEFDPKLLRDAVDVGLAWAGTAVLAPTEREQREQRERDRKHITARRQALAAEAIEEPKAIVASYEVLRPRVEPVGLVYLWPTTR